MQLALLAKIGGIVFKNKWHFLKSIIGDFCSSAQKYNAQFFDHNSHMPNLITLLACQVDHFYELLAIKLLFYIILLKAHKALLKYSFN